MDTCLHFSTKIPGIYMSVEFTQTSKRNAEVLDPPNWCSLATDELKRFLPAFSLIAAHLHQTGGR